MGIDVMGEKRTPLNLTKLEYLCPQCGTSINFTGIYMQIAGIAKIIYLHECPGCHTYYNIHGVFYPQIIKEESGHEGEKLAVSPGPNN